MQHSPRYGTVKAYYDSGRWTAAMVRNAIGRWITYEEAQEILGKEDEPTAAERP